MKHKGREEGKRNENRSEAKRREEYRRGEERRGEERSVVEYRGCICANIFQSTLKKCQGQGEGQKINRLKSRIS